jgi:hypothetical protein
MNPWLERNRRALATLRPLPWAKGLVAGIDRTGITEKADDFLFELRYAHDAARAGLTPEYECAAGVNGSTVDFKFPGTRPWLVELVSVRQSVHARSATTIEIDEPGVTLSSMSLHSARATDDPARAKGTPQHELLRVVHKIGEKVWDGKRPIKFPTPDGAALHMILVDMRGFEGMAGHPDRDHCRQIVGGPDLVSEKAFVASHHDTGEPIRGVWDPANKSQAALVLRERVHVIGFVHEQIYCDDEIRDVTLPFLNPAFFAQEDRLDGYPLRSPRDLDLLSRLDNSLWGKRLV